MAVSYNPFELLNLPMLKDLLRRRSYFLVVQRLHWPCVPPGKGFIATPYQQQKPAFAHAKKLASSEGRLIDLQSETEKILALIESPKYLLFSNTYRDMDWQDRVLKHYQKNIVSNLKLDTSIKAIEEVNIELSFQFGELVAMIQTDESVQEFIFYDLIQSD